MVRLRFELCIFAWGSVKVQVFVHSSCSFLTLPMISQVQSFVNGSNDHELLQNLQK